MNEKWWEAYIGRGWKENEYDCGAFVMDVQQTEFGRDIHLPVERNEYSLSEMQAIVQEQLGYFEDQVEEVTSSPQSGDVVLMKWNGRDTHVGIYVLNKGIPYILHNVEQTGVIFTKVSKLNRLNCSISGIYRPKDLAKSSSATVGINTASSDEGLPIGTDHTFAPSAITEP